MKDWQERVFEEVKRQFIERGINLTESLNHVYEHLPVAKNQEEKRRES